MIFFILTISYRNRFTRVILLLVHPGLCLCVYPLWTGKLHFVDVFSIKNKIVKKKKRFSEKIHKSIKQPDSNRKLKNLQQNESHKFRLGYTLTTTVTNKLKEMDIFLDNLLKYFTIKRAQVQPDSLNSLRHSGRSNSSVHQANSQQTAKTSTFL